MFNTQNFVSSYSPVISNASYRKTVLFSGQSPDSFQKKPTSFDLALEEQYKGSVKSLIQDSVKEENVLGKGSRAKVYRIPKIPGVVLHFKNGMDLNALPTDLTLNRISDPLPLVNIGQPIAGSKDGSIKVLRYQSGETSQIPYHQFFEKYGIDELLSEHKPMFEEDTAPYRRQYAQHLEKVASMPQEAYDDLAKKFMAVQKAGLFVDPCGLNVLTDLKAERFNSVDHQEPIGPYQNALGMACALTDTMFVDLDGHSVDADGSQAENTVATDRHLVALRHQILMKTFLAAYRTGLDMPEEACPLNVFGARQRSFGIDYACDVSGFKAEWPNINELFRQARAKGLSESAFLENLKSI